MNKEEILDRALEKHTHMMSVEAADVMVILFQIGRLKEAGFIEVDTHQITGKGFDLCMDIIEEGWIVDGEVIIKFLDELFEDMDNTGLFALLMAVQEMGISGMLKILEE